ncbi:MAG TPA: alpha-amylase family glycosyl hydrolase [Azospirillaceae bacterium]|nr:alpha-amylase family glycosyl hydrolase [Azospirillaceae bacterium]
MMRVGTERATAHPFGSSGGRPDWLVASAAALFLTGFAPVASPSPSVTAPPWLEIAGRGGDAWTFERLIDGRILPAAGQGSCEAVAVETPAGTFPAWRDGLRFSARVRLDEGPNAVRALCLDGGRAAAVSDPQTWTVRVPDVPKAVARAHAGPDEEAGEPALVLDAGASAPGPGRPAPLVRYSWRADARNPAPLRLADGRALDGAEGRSVSLSVPDADGDYRVVLEVADALGRTDTARVALRVHQGGMEPVDALREAPAWLDHAIVYGVVPVLFGERPLAGVAARLDGIRATGADTLWLSPVSDAPAGDFGYAVTDHFAVRESFGTEAELRALVDAAHARGMRVILDFVPNHVAADHPYHRDAAAHGPASAYHGLFDRGPDGEATSYFDWTHLKNLDFTNPEVQAYAIAASVHWVRTYGIDGFRVDVAWGVRDRAPDFWPRWRAELKRIDPDLLLLAEASARDPYYAAHGFDAAYDWTGNLGEWAWQAAFGDGPRHAGTAARLREAIAATAAASPHTRVFRFLNNNDTGARFATRHGIERMRVAAAMLLTLPGLPGLYTGDEVAAAYEPYGEPEPLAWNDPHGMTAHLGRLSALRRAFPAIGGAGIRFLEVADGRGVDGGGTDVLAYVRPDTGDGKPVLVALNFSDAPATVHLPADPALARRTLRDVLADEGGQVDPAAPLHLPAHGVRVLVPAEP